MKTEIYQFPVRSAPSGISPGEQRVHEALGLWVLDIPRPETSKKSFSRFIRIYDEYVLSPEAKEDSGERVKKLVWIAVFKKYWANCSGRSFDGDLLDELLKDDRWRLLFDSKDTAYAFVSMAIQYLEEHSQPWNNHKGAVMRDRLTSAMSEWMGDANVFQGAPLRDLAAALFGEPWCVFVLDSMAAGSSIAVLIGTTKPEFLPGRLKSALEQSARPLPDLAL
jgi:hypothetical protein